MGWRLHGELRLDLLQHSLDLVVARHESLRVTFGDDEGTPYQVVAPPAPALLVVTDLRELPAAEREERVRVELDAQRVEPYDLETGPLYRFLVLRLDADEYVFCEGFHHIIADGWSVAVVNAELSAAYRNLRAGTEPVFDDRELDYTEFAESQRDRLRGEVLAQELGFWQQLLTDLPMLELPADRPRPIGGSHHGETLLHDFPAELRDIVARLADDHGASMFMVLAAAYNVVLSRYTGLEDIPTGVPMLGRPEPELEAVVGMFINMVVLRSDLSGDPTFSELIDRVADSNLELYEHQEVPFNQVVDAVQPVRDPDRNPLFQVSMQLLSASTSGETFMLPDVAAEFLALAPLSSRFDIGINITDTGSSLRAAVEYSTDMFDGWRIEAMLTHLETVLRGAAADPRLRLSQLPIVTGAESEELLIAGQHADPQVYVVDRSLNLVPRGVTGELLILGDPAEHQRGLAGFSLEKLIDDPFQPGRLVYRSGDRARWTSDLRLELLGQADNQLTPPGPVQTPAEQENSGEPRTPTEQSVAGIFSDVLCLAKVGAEESFFKIGGNSLEAMRAVSRINKTFGIKLSVRTLYGNVTVRAVSAAVDEKVGGLTA
jgi:acyl carrier protein